MTGAPAVVRAAEPEDADWVRASLVSAWGSVLVARKAELLDASTFPAHIAVRGGDRVGLAVYVVRGEEYEVLSLSVSDAGSGVGRALMRHCFADARSRHCRRVWLTTTNNNARAIELYRRLGMSLCAIYPDGVAAARRLKPAIPLRDEHGVAIEHEYEFELLL